MTTLLRSILIICVAACFAAACRNAADDVATPRPHAWPRLVTYPRALTPVSGLPAPWMVNDSTITSVRHGDDGSTWLDVVYPAYADSSTLYITFTPVTDATRDRVIDNRTERLALNNGDLATEVITPPAGPFHATVVRAAGTTATPLQFIAVSPSLVISGAYYIKESGDSVAPYIDAVTDDLIKALSNLNSQR